MSEKTRPFQPPGRPDYHGLEPGWWEHREGDLSFYREMALQSITSATAPNRRNGT